MAFIPSVVHKPLVEGAGRAAQPDRRRDRKSASRYCPGRSAHRGLRAASAGSAHGDIQEPGSAPPAGFAGASRSGCRSAAQSAGSSRAGASSHRAGQSGGARQVCRPRAEDWRLKSFASYCNLQPKLRQVASDTTIFPDCAPHRTDAGRFCFASVCAFAHECSGAGGTVLPPAQNTLPAIPAPSWPRNRAKPRVRTSKHSSSIRRRSSWWRGSPV